MGLGRCINQLVEVHDDMKKFCSGKIFKQARDAEEAQLLLKLKYIEPCTTKIGTLNEGVQELHHYTSTQKGKLYEKVFFEILGIKYI